jgi:hypothetical protein
LASIRARNCFSVPGLSWKSTRITKSIFPTLVVRPFFAALRHTSRGGAARDVAENGDFEQVFVAVTDRFANQNEPPRHGDGKRHEEQSG